MKKIIMATAMVFAVSSAVMAADTDVNVATCKGCHGQNFEKKALGVSKIVKDMTHAEIATALTGYKAGTFGGAMKGVMKGQVSKYSDDDLVKFSKTIGK